MNDKKHEKASHGRHAAGAQKANNTSYGDVSPAQESPMSVGSSPQFSTQQTTRAGKLPPVYPPAVQSPHATAAMPHGGKVPTGEPALRYAPDTAFPPAGPMRPVDAMPVVEAPRHRKALKVVGIILGVFVALLMVAYVGVSVYFMGRFMPQSAISDVNVSLMTTSDAERVLADSIKDYKLAITGQGLSLNLTASEAGLSIDAGEVVKEALTEVNPWMWPFELSKEHDATEKLVASYNGTGLEEAIRAAVEKFNATATQPTNAAIGYDAASSAFVVRPESVGTALDAEAVIKAADKAIVSLDSTAALTPAELLKPTVLSTDQRLVSAAAAANTMIKADLVLSMGGATVGEVNADLISQWTVLGEDLTATLDDAALTAWVDEVVAACNTVGTSRTYTRPDGKVISVAGGVYGWEVDRDALLTAVREGVAAGTVQTVEVPTLSSGSAYSGAGAQDWGARYCDIDLAEQYVRFYDASGALIWESACISGEPDGVHDTPAGVYWVNSPASPSKLVGYENGKKIYESTVQYWMPFVGNYIGLHDADWQPDFGGSMYANGYGSHGCVNLPPALAASLYGIIQSGDVVVCHW